LIAAPGTPNAVVMPSRSNTCTAASTARIRAISASWFQTLGAIHIALSRQNEMITAIRDGGHFSAS
jgi:hypothetical protein